MRLKPSHTWAMVWSEKKNVRQYVDDAIANPYSKNIRIVGSKEGPPTNWSKPMIVENTHK